MNKYYEKKTATDLEQALKICLDLRKDHFWSFRGQRKAAWGVGLHAPASFEAPDHQNTIKEIDDHLRQFQLRCMQFPPPHHIAEWDRWRWLFYGQHHRLTTRLLDWTKDPLVAIYFAVENILSRANDHDDYGAIWALHVIPEHFIYSHTLKAPEDFNDWVVVNPPPITPRLDRQSGLFTYHPGADCFTPLNELDRRHTEKHTERLVKIEIVDRGHKNPSEHIRQQLGILNIHHGSLFPDPDGIANFINHEWPIIAYDRYLHLLDHDDIQ